VDDIPTTLPRQLTPRRENVCISKCPHGTRSPYALNNYPPGQENCILRNLYMQHNIHIHVSLITILSQINPVYASTSYIFDFHLHLISQVVHAANINVSLYSWVTLSGHICSTDCPCHTFSDVSETQSSSDQCHHNIPSIFNCGGSRLTYPTNSL
jgi:hypothetical protein